MRETPKSLENFSPIKGHSHSNPELNEAPESYKIWYMTVCLQKDANKCCNVSILD